MCNTSFFMEFLNSIYSIILGIQGHFRGRKVNSKVKILLRLFRVMLTPFSCHFWINKLINVF